MWGLTHLGLGHTDLSLSHLIRSFRIADRIGFDGVLGDNVLAIGVALAEAGHGSLAWQLIGYGEANLPASPLRDASYDWLQARLAGLERRIDTADRVAALRGGANLDRRGFMRLLDEAEGSAEWTVTRGES